MKNTKKDIYGNPWDSNNVIKFYFSHRNSFDEVYPSERYFLDKYLKKQFKVLDFGCACGGFTKILYEKYKIPFRNYYGVDHSKKMIAIAKKCFSNAHYFNFLREVEKKQMKFPFVLSFGTLHMTLLWRDYIKKLYNLSSKYFIFDVRITKSYDTVEDSKKSYQTLFFAGKKNSNLIKKQKIPYIIINLKEFNNFLKDICSKNDKIETYGYYHNVSSDVVSPYKKVFMMSVCISK